MRMSPLVFFGGRDPLRSVPGRNFGLAVVVFILSSLEFAAAASSPTPLSVTPSSNWYA